MRNKLLFGLVAAGLAAGIASAIIYGREPAPPPPLVTPSPNPYRQGVFANGIIESRQAHGQNTSMYPEVTGVVTAIFVDDGQHVKRGDVVLAIDDSVQRATVAQLEAQAAAAVATLAQLRAQPRKESLAVTAAQVEQAAATLARAKSTRDKQQRSFELDPRSISRQALDDAKAAVAEANAALEVARRQYELSRAGAWSYDVRNQELQAEALAKQAAAAKAQLAKYEVRAARDGVVLAVNAAVGSYVSPQGVYNSLTQSLDPIAIMGESGTLAVRVFVDEILVPRLGDPAQLAATMYVRGTELSVPLRFSRVQPYVTPKVALSNQRTERVDLRVLPVIFELAGPTDIALYPGQLVDVYLRPASTQRSARRPR